MNQGPGSSVEVIETVLQRVVNGIVLFLPENEIENRLIENVKNTVEQDLDFKGNWWGITDTNVIDDKIFDYYDDFNYGKIEYKPILTSLNVIHM